MISGLNASGVDVADLRVSPPAVSRHVLKTQGFAAGVHVGSSHLDPEAVFIRIYEPPGILLTSGLQKEIEKNFTRQELRRVAAGGVGSVSYPARVRESYAQDLLDSIDADGIRERRFRIVVDYGYSAASFVLPLVVGPLGVEAISAHGFFAEELGERESLAQAIGHTKRLVTAIGADLGAVFDQSGERLYLVDEQGHEVPVDQTLLLYVRLLADRGIKGKAAFPVTVTSKVEELAGDGLEIVRTPNSLTDLTQAASEEGVVFAGAVGGGYVFPRVPARVRRDRQPREAARADGADRAAALGTRRRAAGTDADPSPTRLPVGEEGRRHARPQRAPRGPRPRSHRRDQADRRRAAGPRCCPIRTSRSSTCTRKARRPRSPRSSSARCASSSRRSCRETRTRREPL